LLICQLSAQKVTRCVSLLVVTAQALPLTVPLSTALFAGAVHEMVGAAFAASGIAPHAATTAMAIGVL
jgi:hypothetical protein